MAGLDLMAVVDEGGDDALLMQAAWTLQNYCLAMQPICDGRLKHVADELLYRHSASVTFAKVPDAQAMLATTRVCYIAFYEVGIERLAANRQVFVNAPREWLLRPELLPPYPGKLVIEVLESVIGDTEVLASLRKIRAMGFEVALDDFVLTPQTEPLLGVANIVKIDMQQPFDEQAIARYRQSGIRLLAEKVEDMASFEHLRDMGFELFQGYFYARPETQKARPKNRGNNRAALLRLVSALGRTEHNFREIAHTIAEDPRLTFVLLRYANSAFFPYRGSIETTFQALHVLGLRQVRNMAMTMLIAHNGPASRLLLSRAMTRASMCERLASASNQRPVGGVCQEADAAFLVGMLSMMGQLLGGELPALLEEMSLSKELANAVLLRQGKLGSLLQSVERFENAELRGWPPVRIEVFNRIWMKSHIWATEVLAMIDEPY